jgi:hypothetical protein
MTATRNLSERLVQQVRSSLKVEEANIYIPGVNEPAGVAVALHMRRPAVQT